MERLEDAQHRHRDLVAERATADDDLAAAREAMTVALAEIQAEEETLAADRAIAVEGLSAELLALYEKVRADHSGVGAAALFRGRCEGCRIELTPVDVGRIRSAPPEEVLRCEECRRILVRTPESGL
jgi:predicted  nucleic acid-binding Zn-ribbon protein